jgi:hypothetical protein
VADAVPRLWDLPPLEDITRMPLDNGLVWESRDRFPFGQRPLGEALTYGVEEAIQRGPDWLAKQIVSLSIWGDARRAEVQWANGVVTVYAATPEQEGTLGRTRGAAGFEVIGRAPGAFLSAVAEVVAASRDAWRRTGIPPSTDGLHRALGYAPETRLPDFPVATGKDRKRKEPSPRHRETAPSVDRTADANGDTGTPSDPDPTPRGGSIARGASAAGLDSQQTWSERDEHGRDGPGPGVLYA